MNPTKKYKGTFNIAGETHTVYGWYLSEDQARRMFRRQLEKKMGRYLFMKDIDHSIAKI